MPVVSQSTNHFQNIIAKHHKRKQEFHASIHGGDSNQKWRCYSDVKKHFASILNSPKNIIIDTDTFVNPDI